MIVFGLLAALVGTSLAPEARAYVPPSFFIVRMLAHKHATFDDVRFHDKVTFYKKGGDPAYVVSESLVFPDPDHVVVKIDEPSGGEISRQTRKLVAGGKESDLGRPALYDLLYVRDGGSLFEHFKLLGLPLKTESALYEEKEAQLPYKPEAAIALERYEGRIAIVLGDRTKKADVYGSPSLWVEKDSFLPLRAILPSSPESGMASEPLEYRMSGFTGFRSFLYPRVVQIFRNGQLWVKIETQDARTGGGAVAEDSHKADVSGDLKDNVDAYLKWVR